MTVTITNSYFNSQFSRTICETSDQGSFPTGSHMFWRLTKGDHLDRSDNPVKPQDQTRGSGNIPLLEKRLQAFNVGYAYTISGSWEAQEKGQCLCLPEKIIAKNI